MHWVTSSPGGCSVVGHCVYCVTLVLVLVLLHAVPASANAADKPNLLVMGEDADPDTVPRDSRIFQRVLDAISNQLNDQGFDVYDETAVTMDDFLVGRVRRTDAEIIDVAQSVRRPRIDVVVIFSIYLHREPTAASGIEKVRARVEGRLLNIRGGQKLGNFEVSGPDNWTAPTACKGDCMLEKEGQYSKYLSADLGAVLAEKLAWMVDGDGESNLQSSFILLFDDFSPEEIGDIQEYLMVFSGYQSHRPLYVANRRAEILYESTIDTAKLNSNLHKMLKALELNGTVTMAGNAFTLKKSNNTKPKKVIEGDW